MHQISIPFTNLSEETSVILDSITDGIFTVSEDFVITSFNQAAEAINGVSPQKALGKACCDVFHVSICETACALRETMRTGRPIQCRPIHIVRPDGKRVPLSISTALLRDAEGRSSVALRPSAISRWSRTCGGS